MFSSFYPHGVFRAFYHHVYHFIYVWHIIFFVLRNYYELKLAIIVSSINGKKLNIPQDNLG